MVSWDELVVPAVSQNDNADDAHSSVIADCWEVLNDLDVGVALWNERGILLHCNAVFKDAFNANANVCRPGAAIQQMLVMSGLETGTAAREWVTEFLEAHRNSGSVEWRTRSGKWLHAQIWRRSDGHRLCRLRDVSTEKRLEQECRQLAQVSTAGSPMAKGLAHMGHELRTPLNAIMGFSDLIRSEAIGPVGHASYAEYAQDIYNSGAVLLTAVDRISLLVKLEAGLIRPQSVAVPCSAIGASAVEAVRVMADEAGVDIIDATGAEQHQVFIDRDLASSTLVYLLENAVAATPPDGSVDLRCQMDEAGDVVFRVCDRGTGIAPDQLTAILEPFVRLDSANPHCTPGVGMGLPLADRTAELLTCSIELTSEPGAGTIAELRIPADRIVAE